MKKTRFIYWILSMIIMILSLILVWVDDNYIPICIIIVMPLFFLNIYLRKKEKNQIINIMIKYSQHCDPAICYKELYDFNKTCFRNKKLRIYDKMSYSLLKMDEGAFEEAEGLLLSIVDEEKKFPNEIKFLYYRCWISVLLEKKDLNRVQSLLKEEQRIIDSTNKLIKEQLLANYQIIIAKYYVISGTYFDIARNIFESILKNNNSPLTTIVCFYYLALINLKTKEFEKAKNQFNYVANTKKNVFCVKRAKQYLEKLNEIEFGNNSNLTNEDIDV